ncbi:MAG: UDP-N-acetylmuramate dehydrogenase [Candidatus Aenigmatarchaeota archaeon]
MSLKELELRYNLELKKYTTIKIGGIVKHFFIAHNYFGLKEIIEKLKGNYYILGGGSNILVNEPIVKKPIIKLGEGFSYIKKDKELLEVGSATPLAFLLRYCLQNNLGGLVGIPATIGGLIKMNASSFEKEISFCLDKIEVMDNCGESKFFERKDIEFGYRSSSLKDYIILRAWFKLEERKAIDIKMKMKEYLTKRIKTQDFGFPSCGCIFKNPKDYKAGFLIEACNLKGLKRNDALVSLKHANFIVNLGKASYQDVDYLIQRIKEEVFKKFGVVLEEEIIRWM